MPEPERPYNTATTTFKNIIPAVISTILLLITLTAQAQKPDNKSVPKSSTDLPSGPVSQAPIPGGPKTVAKLPKGVPQLKAMYIDSALFHPDKWWIYESFDDDRPPQYAVEEQGKMVVGEKSVISHSALVTYHVLLSRTSQEAHARMISMIDRTKRSRNQKRTEKILPLGDEGMEIGMQLISDKNVVEDSGRETFVRYGRYLVHIFGRSDLRAFGPRPQTGERRGMDEPVYDRVQAAALKRWTNYKTLLATR